MDPVPPEGERSPTMRELELQPSADPRVGARTAVGAVNVNRWQTYDLVQNLEVDWATLRNAGRQSVRTSPDRDSPTFPPNMTIPTLLPRPATQFRFEHGRRFNAYAESKYPLPNDEQEIGRLEIQHWIWNGAFNGRLHLAPLGDDITDVLDIGTGTGTWAAELAKRRRNTRVVGTDLSPIQPLPAPPNCSWVVADANEDWPAHFRNAFDYVHTRTITLGVTDWSRLLDQATASLRPGGWVEMQEFFLPMGSVDGSMAGTALERWGELMRDGSAARGVDATAALSLADKLLARGYERVREVRLKVPIGPWAKRRAEKEIGWLGLRDMHENLLGLSVKTFAELGWSTSRTAELCEQAKKDMMSTKIHSYMPLVIVWGQSHRQARIAATRLCRAYRPAQLAGEVELRLR